MSSKLLKVKKSNFYSELFKTFELFFFDNVCPCFISLFIYDLNNKHPCSVDNDIHLKNISFKSFNRKSLKG